MKRVTLADIAAEVGVSAKTVSNVVNGTGWVGDDTRQRILASVKAHGYRPNLAARNLRGGASGMLALAIPDLREPYFAEFASRLVTCAEDRGVTVLVSQTGGLRAQEILSMEGEGLPALAGMILSPLELTAEDVRARRARHPLVLLGEHGAAIAGAGSVHVGIDNVAAATAATEHLINRGRTRIAVVGVQSEGSVATARLRVEGYRKALQRAGIPYDESLLFQVSDFNRAEGAQAVDRLIGSGVQFDALFCFNDTLALGAMYALGAHGVAIPAEVEVVGFDDIEEGKFITPAFSTIDPGMDAAARLILDIIAAPDLERGPVHRDVPFTLIDRVSESVP